MDINYFKTVSEKIFSCDSPSGYTKNVINIVQSMIHELGYETTLQKKGNLVVKVKGKNREKTIATSAHVDTLSLMVRSINDKGQLCLTAIGGINASTLDGEYCKVLTRDGQLYSGTVVYKSPSLHVNRNAASEVKTVENLEVRLDEKVHSKQDVQKLGIQNGDYVFIDPKYCITDSGFLKSRFIDDKAAVCILLMILKEIKEKKIELQNNTHFYFVDYEEVGHGAATIESCVEEFVTIDMGCVGDDLAGNEYAVSIGAKDASGPYDYELTTRLINMAKKLKLNFVVDIYPFYGSDVSAALRSGCDIKGGLIGPGVAASHGMERTHLDAIEQTYLLMLEYLTK